MNVQHAMEIREVVMLASECSFYLEPLDPWLTREEILEVGSRMDFLPGGTARGDCLPGIGTTSRFGTESGSSVAAFVDRLRGHEVRPRASQC